MVGFEKVLGAVKVIKDQIQYMSQSLLNLARDYFGIIVTKTVKKIFRPSTSADIFKMND